MLTIKPSMMNINCPIQISISSNPPIVDFLVMGTQKGGTTSLHSVFRQDPDGKADRHTTRPGPVHTSSNR